MSLITPVASYFPNPRLLILDFNGATNFPTMMPENLGTEAAKIFSPQPYNLHRHTKKSKTQRQIYLCSESCLDMFNPVVFGNIQNGQINFWMPCIYCTIMNFVLFFLSKLGQTFNIHFHKRKIFSEKFWLGIFEASCSVKWALNS